VYSPSGGNLALMNGQTLAKGFAPLSGGATAVYAYDNLNRLSTAAATGSSTYNLTFNYDRFGNMGCVTNGQTNGPCPNWTFNSNNQINTSGFTHDAAGVILRSCTGWGATSWR